MSFQHIKPTDKQLEVMQDFRDIFENLSGIIKNDVKDSRGRALCLTKLEEAAFWLNKAITKNDK
jgi:hypothetical protein